jgi:hypothetical protein
MNLMRQAVKLWKTGDRDLDRYNRRAWIRARRRLGDRWILAQPIRRHDEQNRP